MRKVIFIFLSFMILSSGCGKQKASAELPDYLKEDFATKFKSSQKFLDYMDAGDRAYESGQYQVALGHYKSAEEISHGRSFQTMVNEALAKTYEKMQDYESASHYYKAASESTMNDERKNYFAAAQRRVNTNGTAYQRDR